MTLTACQSLVSSGSSFHVRPPTPGHQAKEEAVMIQGRHRVLAGFSGNPMELWRVTSFDDVVGQKILVGDDDARSMLGGTTFNLADGFARLSDIIDCRSLITVGAQPDSGRDMLAQVTLERGFDCRFLACRRETSRAVIIQEDSGRATILGRKSAYVSIPSDDVREEVDRYQPDCVIASGVVDDDAILVAAMFEQARLRQAARIFNPRRELITAEPAFFRRLASLSNMLVVNDIEAAAIVGLDAWPKEPEHAPLAAILELGPEEVIVTCNAHGSVYADHAGQHYQPAVDVGPIHETTGAGDSFLAGFLVARFEGYGIKHSMHFASVVAGIKVSRREPGMPEREQVNDVLADH